MYDQSGNLVNLSVISQSQLVSKTDSTCRWIAGLGGAIDGIQLSVTVAGSLDYDSYLEYSFNVSSSAAVRISDIQLSYRVPVDSLTGLVGFGSSGGAYHDQTWRWSNSTGNPFVWIGRVEAGLFLKLKGAGDAWNSPMFGEQLQNA